MSEETPESGTPVQQLIKKLMWHLGEFGGKLHEAREKCRAQYRSAEPEPRNRFRIMIDGLMALLADAVRTPIANVTESSSYQITLSASFIRTHFVITDLAMNGDVVETFVLVRKQLESLARLNELDAKPLAKLRGKTPNIQNALRGGAGRIYGDLSEIAHFATPRVAEFLHVIERGPATGPSLLSVYSERAVACMDLCQFVALYFQMWMIEKLKEWYPSKDNADLMTTLGITIGNALEAGVIREAEGTPKDGGG
jgi:hypothetical protein